MLTTARSPETETYGFAHVSTAIRRNESPRTTMTFMLFLT